jgi:hypothetical protein
MYTFRIKWWEGKLFNNTKDGNIENVAGSVEEPIHIHEWYMHGAKYVYISVVNESFRSYPLNTDLLARRDYLATRFF